LLHGRARYAAIAAIHTTITLLWFQYCLTIGALIKILASIGGHGFFLFMKTNRAGYY